MQKRVILIFAIVGILFLAWYEERTKYEYIIDYIWLDWTTGTITCEAYYPPHIRESDSSLDWRQRGSLICWWAPVALAIQAISYKKIEE